MSTPPVEISLPVTVERYDASHRTGISRIDRGLKGPTIVYLARVDGIVAHHSFLSFNVPPLRQYGLDPQAPMITSGFTEPQFRCKHLQAFVLRHLVQDVLARGLGKEVFGEIYSENIASLKGNARGGLQPILRIKGTKFVGLLFHRKVSSV